MNSFKLLNWLRNLFRKPEKPVRREAVGPLLGQTLSLDGLDEVQRDFVQKMNRYGLGFDWTLHPQTIIDKVDDEIDALSNLGEAKTFLKRMNRYYMIAIWVLLQRRS